MQAVTTDTLSKIIYCLPEQIKNALLKIDYETRAKIYEIRMRVNRVTCITLSGKNVFLSQDGLTEYSYRALKTSFDDIEKFLYCLCKGSVYSYENSLKHGFVSVSGARIGISGQVILSGSGSIDGFSVIEGVNIRLQHHISGCSRPILEYISASGFPARKGILVASAPSNGKTTLLRDLAINLSQNCTVNNEKTVLRVCVIDERNEIKMENIFDRCNIDFISDCSKAKGIEIATRVLSPQVIICDEIGTKQEADEILHAVLSGIYFIASVHASSLEEITAKPHIKTLIDYGVFGMICILIREGEKIFPNLNMLNGKEKPL